MYLNNILCFDRSGATKIVSNGVFVKTSDTEYFYRLPGVLKKKTFQTEMNDV